MLVPENVVNEWFKPGHPIRKSFDYLFQNPLWTKDVPKGFSVCLYFWMSVVLSPLFRFFLVWPIVYFFGPTVNFLNLGKLDRFLYELSHKILRFKKTDYKTGYGMIGLFLSLLLLSVIGAGLLVLWVFFMVSLASLKEQNQSTAPFLLAVGGIISWFVVLFFTCRYKKIHNDSKCKVEVYAYLWMVTMVVLIGVFAYSEFLTAVSGFAGGILGLIFWVWNCICTVCGWIASFFIGMSVFFLNPYVLFAMFFLFFGPIALGWFVLFLTKDSRKARVIRPPDYSDYWLKRISGLLTYRNKIYYENMGTNENKIKHHLNAWFRSYVKPYKIEIPLHLLNELIYDLLGVYEKTSRGLSRLKERGPKGKSLKGVDVPREVRDFIFDLERILQSHVSLVWNVSPETLDRSVKDMRGADSEKEALTFLKGRLELLLETRAVKLLIKDEKRKIRKRAEWEKWCESVTGKISVFIVKPLKKLGSIAWVGIKNFAVLVAFIWVLIWAAKKGMCPYKPLPREQEPELEEAAVSD